jgi:hypothetical protein
MSWEWWNVPQKTVFTPPPPRHKPEAPGWISVHDALPELDETVLAWYVDGIGAGYSLARYVRRGQYGQERVWMGLFFIADSHGYAMSDILVSHWRRLPEPPGREPST